MRKLLIAFLLLLFLSIKASSQPQPIITNNAGALGDFERLNLSVYIPPDTLLINEEVNSSEYAWMKRTLRNQLQSLVSQNGFSGSYRRPKFIIFPRLLILNIDIKTSAPALYIVEMELSLYVADAEDGLIFNSYTVYVQGVGKSERKARISALKSLKNDSPMREFMRDGRTSILQYFNDRCDYILQQAKLYSDTKEHQKAFNLLLQIPQESKDCYMEAISRIPEYFNKHYEKECSQNLHRARSLWAIKRKVYERAVSSEVELDTAQNIKENEIKIGGNDINSATIRQQIANDELFEAILFLKEIPTDSPCYEDTQILLNEIKTYVDTKRSADRALLQKIYNDQAQMKEFALKKAAEISLKKAETEANLKNWGDET